MRLLERSRFVISALVPAGLLLILFLRGGAADGPDPSADGSSISVISLGDSARAPTENSGVESAGADTGNSDANTGSAGAGNGMLDADSGKTGLPTAGDSSARIDSSVGGDDQASPAPEDSSDDSTAGSEPDSAAAGQNKPPPIPLDQLRVVDNNSFGVGERLEFEISYGPINAGSAVMEVKEVVPMNGRDSYRVISTAQSNRFFSAIYRVEDRVESFIDIQGLFPWKFQQKLQEGKHRANRWAVYDQINHTVSTNRGDLDTPPYVQDVLSILYYARTQEMAVGETLYVDSHSGRKVYPLAVKILSRERVEVPAGTFNCLVVEPMLKAGGLFKHEGRIWVWLTDDAVRLPVLMKTKVIIGTVDAKLKTYRLGKIL